MTPNSPFKYGRGVISEGGFTDRIHIYFDYGFKSEYQTDGILVFLFVIRVSVKRQPMITDYFSFFIFLSLK